MDYRPALYGRGGIAVYTRELALALAATRPADTLVLYGRRLRRRRRTPYGGADVVGTNVHLLDGPLPSRALPWLARAGFGLDRLCGGLDLLHWTDYTTLPPGRARVVATVHDVLFDELPDCYTSEMRRGLRRTTRRIVSQADHLIVPSVRTEQGLLRHYDADPHRITVVPHGHRRLPDGGPREIEGPYVLFVGTLEPRKNLARLIQAFDQARAERDDVRLVVAGGRGWLDEELHRAVVAHPAITYVGAVGAERLGGLYTHAQAVAYPSLGEGFGLPVLEAMARGRPLLVATDTTCADIAGDAALDVDPRAPEAMAQALGQLLDDESLRAALGAEGRRLAAAYDWTRAAAATRQVYAQVVGAEVPA